MGKSTKGLNRYAWAEIKIYSAKTKFRKLCKCGHSIDMTVINKKARRQHDYVICSHCGHKVFKDEKTEKEYRKEESKRDFRNKLGSLLETK